MKSEIHRSPVCLLLAVTVMIVFGCSNAGKLSRLEKQGAQASLALPPESAIRTELADSGLVAPRGDTLKVKGLFGEEMIIMKAERDEESGEMVARDRIDAAIVSAKFRNVAERSGMVKLEFQVRVPKDMHDSEWQVRLYPKLYVLQDSLDLDGLLITGDKYRKNQLRGYQQYQRFLSRIISDTLRLVDMRNLEIFISRNFPDLYAFRADSSYVSDEEFRSGFGLTEEQVWEHYTLGYLVRRNARLRSRRDRKWKRYVKAPIVEDGIKLDTVFRDASGDFVYNYVQNIATRPGLRKVEVRLQGDIYKQESRIYNIPRSEPLTFYVSSMGGLVENTEKYLTKVISRNVYTNTTGIIDFRAGESAVDDSYGGNASEIERIRKRLRSLSMDSSYEMDSIVIVASASPDASNRTNVRLSYDRAKSVSAYFKSYLDRLQDSLRREEGIRMNLDGSGPAPEREKGRSIDFLSRSGGENWQLLGEFVQADTLMTAAQKADYTSLQDIADPDDRELAMSSRQYFPRLKADYYPKLRTVRFNFYLHRTGMIKDTIHTTVLDSVYMDGLRLLREFDYDGALEKLLPYRDYNTALAFTALDRNLSALQILEETPRTPKVNYLLAILYSRQGRDQEAVQAYLSACQEEPSYRHRGNLDPEIAVLKNRYRLEDKI